MEIGRINFPEKGPMRGQYKYCIAKKVLYVLVYSFYSEDLSLCFTSDTILTVSEVLLEMFVLINL